MKPTTIEPLNIEECEHTGSLPNPVTRALGKNLKRRREASNMTQSVLGSQAGIERARISKIESGLVNPSLMTLARLSSALDVSLPKLFDGIPVGSATGKVNCQTHEEKPTATTDCPELLRPMTMGEIFAQGRIIKNRQ